MNIRKILDDIKSDRVKKVIIDTDTANEVDDQFAIAYALGCDKVELLSINAVPFTHDGIDHKTGVQMSYNEIKRVLAAYSSDCKIPVYMGAAGAIELNGGKPIDCPAVRNIIDTAMASDETIYVLGIGAATNIASALMLEPAIKEKICVIWLGGTSIDSNNLGEYNLVQDYTAGQVLIDSGAPLVLCPAWNVTCVLYARFEEFTRELKDKGPMCTLLWQLINEYYHGAKKLGAVDRPESYGRTIWDIAAVALLSKPECGTFKIIPAPIFSEERIYHFDESRHEMIYLEALDRDTVYADAWPCIQSLRCDGEYIPRWTEETEE